MIFGEALLAAEVDNVTDDVRDRGLDVNHTMGSL